MGVGSTNTVLRRGVEFDPRCGHRNFTKSLSRRKKRWPEWMEEAREWRRRLLDKQRDLREHEGEEFETVQMLLKEVSSLLKEAREKVNEQRTAELEEEMSEAWRHRQVALLHALRV